MASPPPPVILKAGQPQRVEVQLNGQPRQAWAEPRMLLSDFIRQELGATGTHVGCEHGVCGACTVLLDGVAQRSCLILAVQCHQRRVDTVEGLAAQGAEAHKEAKAEGNKEANKAVLGELQAAFKRHHALQCGFCTAGILMSCAQWLPMRRARRAELGAVTEAEVREMLSGHLCRCTGYTPIIEAILELAHA